MSKSTGNYEPYFEDEFDFDDEEKKQAIANRLRNAIKSSGMNQYQFARKCKISYETLRTYLKGNAAIRFDVIIRAAHALDVSYEYLLCEDNTIVPTNEEPLPTRIEKATHISKEASAKLVELGFLYCKSSSAKQQIDCISELIENDGILETITNYFCYIRNKNLKEWNAKNKEEWKYSQKIKPHCEYNCDCETVLLFQMMKKIDNSTKRKLMKKNQKGK